MGDFLHPVCIINDIIIIIIIIIFFMPSGV